MVKTNTIKKLVNGEIADADDVNQIIENAGNEGGGIPYSDDTQQRETGGAESLGATSYPWGDFHVSRDQHLIEVDPISHTEASSVTFSQLRKFISQKDTPDSYAGDGEKYVTIKSDETGVEFVDAPIKSNVLFHYQAFLEESGGLNGRITASTLTPAAPSARYNFISCNSLSYIELAVGKFKKIAGVSTITVYAQVWGLTAGTPTHYVQVDIGGQTGSANTTAGTPTWLNFTVDVSGLSDGTVYDISAQLKYSGGSGTPVSFLGTIFMFGS